MLRMKFSVRMITKQMRCNRWRAPSTCMVYSVFVCNWWFPGLVTATLRTWKKYPSGCAFEIVKISFLSSGWDGTAGCRLNHRVCLLDVLMIFGCLAWLQDLQWGPCEDLSGLCEGLWDCVVWGLVDQWEVSAEVEQVGCIPVESRVIQLLSRLI